MAGLGAEGWLTALAHADELPEVVAGAPVAKRAEYRAAGLPVLLGAFLTDAGDVHLEWLVRRDRRWESLATATAEQELVVDDPRSFRVVPDALLRPRA